MGSDGDASTCANCGFENPAGARFCNQCGASLGPVPRGLRGEKRQITVVFSDLSGFTAMSEHMDPEDVRTVMERIFASATGIIQRYSGRVDKLLGDAVMSVFGDPISHEDDAERAVRATLEIHAVVDELSIELEDKIGRKLRMHSGVNTGMVVTSSGAFDTADTGPLGDTINVAARLEDLSEAGEILLGPETANLVGNVFELEDYGSHDLKGKTGLTPVAKVIGLKHERTGPSRRQADFVGRHEELGILLAAVEGIQDGEGGVIGIRAEAGAGKTRLLDEFHRRVHDKVQWLEGRAYAYGENIPFAALVDLISNATGIAEDDTQDSMLEKLRSGVGPLVGHDDRLLDPFFRLYGLPEREDAGLDKDSFQDRLLESLTAVIDGLCSRAPTVLVLQDLHWADPSTVGTIRHLVQTVAIPVLIVANYRPNFAGILPGLREIELGALSPRQSGEMVQSLLDDGDPPTELVSFIVDRTDGNPFYIEEIINSLLETGTLARDDGTWQVAGSLTDADIPTSVRGVIASRIDRLDTDRKRVLREASVIGRQFLYEVIKRVATETEVLDPSLEDLETADLIREKAQQSDLEYFFKHALTQDVAYEGLLKSERIELHARVAAAIEAQFAGRVEEVTETLAYHYSEGAVLEKAVEYLRAAGRKAMDRYALVEAEAHFRRAYEMLEAADQDAKRDRAIVDLLLDWALLFYYQAHLDDLGDLLDLHQGSVDRLNDDTKRMWWLVWRGYAASSYLDLSDNLSYLDEALEIARSIGSEAGVAYARTWMIWSHFITGDVERALAHHRDIDPWVTANRRVDPYPYFKSRITSVYAASMAGRAEHVEEMCREVIAFGEEVGNNRCVAFGYQGLAFHNILIGNYRDSIGYGRRAAAIAKDPIYRDTAYLALSAAGTLAGDDETVLEADRHITAAVERDINLTTPLFVSSSRAAALAIRGRLTEGIEMLLDTSERAVRASRAWEGIFAEFFIGITYARIITGELRADLKTLARNPGFIPYLRRARKQAEPRLRDTLEKVQDVGYMGAAHLIEVELAKLLIHRGEVGEARQLLESALGYTSRYGEGEGTTRIRNLLSRI